MHCGILVASFLALPKHCLLDTETTTHLDWTRKLRPLNNASRRVCVRIVCKQAPTFERVASCELHVCSSTDRKQQHNMTTLSIADLEKVAIIFEAADIDQDARLDSAELKELIQQCNPNVCFSVVQLEAIVQEVFSQSSTSHATYVPLLCACESSLACTRIVIIQVLEQYEGSAQAPGLSRQSLAQLYMDGVGDCDMDLKTMHLGDKSHAPACLTARICSLHL